MADNDGSVRRLRRASNTRWLAFVTAIAILAGVLVWLWGHSTVALVVVGVLYKRLEIKHLFTRPYRPRTNGKAERFIQTLLRKWAYFVVYPTSEHRARALGPWLHFYNHQRPHGSLGHQAPATRLPAAA